MQTNTISEGSTQHKSLGGKFGGLGRVQETKQTFRFEQNASVVTTNTSCDDPQAGAQSSEAPQRKMSQGGPPSGCTGRVEHTQKQIQLAQGNCFMGDPRKEIETNLLKK